MIMNLSALFIRRPIGTSLLAAIVFLMGVLCYVKLGVASLPNVNIPVIFVHATQSGADATTIASTVTAPLERHLGQVPGIDHMRSTSVEGSSIVFLVFETGRHVDSAAQDVQTAISATQSDLPTGLATPLFRKANPNADPIIGFALTSKTQSIEDLYQLADSTLAQRLRQISGISSVDIAGASTPAVRVDFDLRKLNALGLTPEDVRHAIQAGNVEVPTGFLANAKTTIAIAVNDQLHHATEFAKLAIAKRADGRLVRLADVAQVYDGQQDGQQAAWLNQQRAVLMYAFMRNGSNTVQTVDQVKALVPELQHFLAPGTSLTPYFDLTPTIRASLHEVQVSLCISLVMVIVTMALFLKRMEPTLIAATAVPLSLAGSAILMYVLDFTLNNLSLLALVVAIGFVVDDAIVVIENISRHLDQGLAPDKAATVGAKEIGFTIVSITISLVAVFIPILFAKGIVGIFFREFAITLTAAILLSMIVSLTLTPALCSRFLSATTASKPNWISLFLDRTFDSTRHFYEIILDFSLRHRWLLSITPLVFAGLTYVLIGMVDKGAFPPQDTGLIFGRANSSATISFEELSKRQDRIAKMLLADPAVELVSVRLGSGMHGSSVSFNIQLKPLNTGRQDSTQVVVNRLSAKANLYPDLELRLRAIQDLPSNGNGGSSQGALYRVTLQGNDLAQLQAWMPKITNQLKKLPQLRDVGSDVDSSALRQDVIIDRDKAAQLGISIGQIDSALYGAFGQRAVSTIYTDTDQYSLVINAQASQMATPSALDQIQIPNRYGTMVPMSAITHQQSGLSPPQIDHDNQRAIMDLSYNLAPGVSMGQAQAIIAATIDNLRLPGDIRLSDDEDFFSSANPDSMLVLLIAAIITVYIVLGMLYESLVHPITILSTLPAAGVGALLALKLTHTELSIISMIALILLVGIVKKNAIMMIDFALDAQRQQGLTALEAARQASIVRFRPIMMTTMVSILAAVPLAIGLGEGSELRRPLGIAMIGGLLVSQTLTLFSTPALYVLLSSLGQQADRCRLWLSQHRWKKSLTSSSRATPQ